MSKTIRQAVTFRATPHEVYEALMDEHQHARFTGDTAEISREVGGKIMAYGGYITGENQELIPDQKIVQAWHASDWPEGHMSTVTFVFMPVPNGTHLNFTHSDVPDDQYEDIKQGWVDNYWEPMKRMLEKK